MKRILPLFTGLVVVIVAAVAFYSCQKDTSINNKDVIPPGKMKLSVLLTDGPYHFQKVLIDIKGIAVKVDTCLRNSDDDHDYPGCDDHHDRMENHCEYWDTLDINPGVYDLMALRNGLDTLLASGFLIKGKIERIKISFGDRDSVMTDSVMHPLNMFQHFNFIYINVHREHLDSISSNNFQVHLDFDVSRSIWYFGGNYWLLPFFRPFSHHYFGSIEGKIRPEHSFEFVKAFNTTDTAYAKPWENGEFKIRGLKAGTYDVMIQGKNGYKDSTISSIEVRKGRETYVGKILLHQ